MLTVIGVIALLFVGKFVYDTFLTDNTERDWNEYQRTNPHKATVLENNEGLNLKTDYSVRKDGVYVLNYKGTSQYGQRFELTLGFIFLPNNQVCIIEEEGDLRIDGVAAGKLISDARSQQNEPNKNVFDTYSVNRGEISIKFGNKGSEEYKGSVLKDGLILSRIANFYSYELMKETSKVSATDLRFRFVLAAQ